MYLNTTVGRSMKGTSKKRTKEAESCTEINEINLTKFLMLRESNNTLA